MKNVFVASVLCLLVLTGATCGNRSSLPHAEQADNDTPASGSFAVLELFTSEGCSSCPPADKLLNTLAVEAEKKNLPVYALAFHVDYWDRLGWKDPYSAKEFSDRQRTYSRILGLDGVYTPQIVINGRQEYVGSDETRIRAALSAALRQPAHRTLSLHAMPMSIDALRITYTLDSLPQGCVLNVALVRHDLTSRVTTGENAGRTLFHEGVVNAFVTVPVTDTTGVATLPFTPSGANTPYSVIGYLQRKSDFQIVAAATVEP